MWDNTAKEFKPILPEAVTETAPAEPSLAVEPVFHIGQEVTLNGIVFRIDSIKRKRIILKAVRKV